MKIPYHTNLRRVHLTWARAVEIANMYAVQTGFKHRIERYRGGWLLRRTDLPVRLSTDRRSMRAGRLPR